MINLVQGSSSISECMLWMFSLSWMELSSEKVLDRDIQQVKQEILDEAITEDEDFDDGKTHDDCEVIDELKVAAEVIANTSYCSIDEEVMDIRPSAESKTFSLLSKQNPYPVPISKLECVGHVQKRLGTGLRKLKKEKKLGGRGCLTDNIIDAMQTYYGKAIRNNKGDVKGMQKATLAILYHQASTDKKPQHKFCPSGSTSWCKYNNRKRGELYQHKITYQMMWWKL